MMGMKGGTSYYASVWSMVHKNDHWKMDLDSDYYYSSNLKRTFKKLNDLALTKMQK